VPARHANSPSWSKTVVNHNDRQTEQNAFLLWQPYDTC
jgi:hypothetical protein